MAYKDSTLTQQYLKVLFTYDSDTGSLKWNVNKSTRARIGNEAGSFFTNNHGKRYREVRIDNEHYFVHRIIWMFVYGGFPSEQIDHKDGNGCNNKLENLRAVTHAENGRNARKQIRNTSGITGVIWDKRSKNWRSRIHFNGKDKHLGMFIEKWDAICARKSAQNKLGFHVNHGQVRPL